MIAADKDLLTIKEASEWASDYLKKNVITSNISYLIQYGLIKKIGTNGAVQIDKQDLKEVNYENIHGELNKVLCRNN